MIRYASVCDGISAVSVAWRHLGWECAWVSEIDPFASAVLAERWPDHHNVGDMLAIDERILDRGPIDLLVGGTPCQSFSIAGLRGGLDDARGNLALRFCQLAGTLRPRWVVWENVPGVLSSNGGRDFGAIVGALEQLGYRVAYRILDAQFFGVPQRRRRVFLVGHLGDWRRSAAVLFDSASLRGDSPARLKTRKDVALCPTLRAGGNSTGGHRPPGTDVDTVESLQVVAGTVTAGLARSRGAGTAPESLIAGTVSAKLAKGTGGPSGDECQNLIAHTLRGEGFDASEDGTGRGTPLVATTVTCRPYCDGDDGASRLVPVAYRTAGDGGVYTEGDVTAPLTTNTDRCANILAYQCQGSNVGPMGTLRAGNGNQSGGVPFVPIAIQERAVATNPTTGPQGAGYREDGLAYTLEARHRPQSILPSPLLAVRRLTPRECERLQGFPDDYTLVKYRGKPAADGPRYKAIGNSMAVPCMAWLGNRIAFVDRIGKAVAS